MSTGANLGYINYYAALHSLSEETRRSLHDQAARAWNEGDMDLFFLCVPSHSDHYKRLFQDNEAALKARGLLESAIARMYVGSKVNTAAWTLGELKKLLESCNREKLRAMGQPLPGDGPFVVYRGIAGGGRYRRIKGFSWTASLDLACWFATRLRLENPAVYTTTFNREDILFYTNVRNEQEFVGIPRFYKRIPLTTEAMKGKVKKGGK